VFSRPLSHSVCVTCSEFLELLFEYDTRYTISNLLGHLSLALIESEYVMFM